MFPLGTAQNIFPQNIQGNSSLLKSTVCRKERVIATLFTIQCSAVLQTYYYKALSHWNQSQNIALNKRKKKKKICHQIRATETYIQTHEPVCTPAQQAPQGCSDSNGLDPQLQFTSITSRDLSHVVLSEEPWPHLCQQFSKTSFWNYRDEQISCIKMDCTEQRLHLSSWPPPLHHGHPYQANPCDAEQETVGPSGSQPLLHPILIQCCPSACSSPTSL